MRLIRAELLKMRRRQATWVVLIVLVVLMVITYLLTGEAYRFLGIIEFPGAYGVIGQFAFALGGLLAIVYSAAFVGADWNWGVVRNVVARGESRARYLLAKCAALAIGLGVAMLIIFALGIALTFVQGWIYGLPVESPLRGRGFQDLIDWLLLGYPVLLQRAALGVAVAVVLRSQLAGAVVGIVFFIGESILIQILTAVSFFNRVTQGGLSDPEGPFLGFEPIGPEWFQFLPISIGGNILVLLPGGGGAAAAGGLQNLLLRPVPFEIAVPSVVLYIVGLLGVSIVALNRQEIA
jgi:ABC-type transport system involved in multi-copper enzyme maturation permease subunit